MIRASVRNALAFLTSNGTDLWNFIDSNSHESGNSTKAPPRLYRRYIPRAQHQQRIVSL